MYLTFFPGVFNISFKIIVKTFSKLFRAYGSKGSSLCIQHYLTNAIVHFRPEKKNTLKEKFSSVGEEVSQHQLP